MAAMDIYKQIISISSQTFRVVNYKISVKINIS